MGRALVGGKRVGAALAVCALALALAACGGGADPPAGNPATAAIEECLDQVGLDFETQEATDEDVAGQLFVTVPPGSVVTLKTFESEQLAREDSQFGSEQVGKATLGWNEETLDDSDIEPIRDCVRG